MTRSMPTVVVVAATAAALTTWTIYRWMWNNRRKCPPFDPVPPLDDPLKRGLKKTNLPARADVIVIGSGPSGLATACLLVDRGYRVLVLEQHDRAGGGLHSFTERGKYQFDTGFHYLGEMAPHEPLRKIVDYLTDHGCEWSAIGDCSVEPGVYDQVHFLNEDYSDGENALHRPFDVPVVKNRWILELKRTFPDDLQAIDTYVADMEACSKTNLLYAIWRSIPFSSWLSWMTRPLLAWPACKYNTVLASERIDQLTHNPRLKAVLGYISLGCVAICPDQLNYALMLGLHAHFGDGAHYPVHGPARVAAAMVKKIERGGGRVLVRAGVDRILVEPGSFLGRPRRTVVGVQLVKEGLIVRAPIVVSSIGLRETVHGLLRKPDDPGPQAINSGFSGTTADHTTDALLPDVRAKLGRLLDELPHGHGHIYGFVGIQHDPNGPSLNLPRRNCWFLPSYDLREGVDAFQRDAKNPFGYVGLAFPSEKDPSYKDRHGHGVVSAAFVAGDVPWEWFQQWANTRVHKRGDDYEQFKESFQERLLELLYAKYPQVKGKVDYVDLGTPVDTRTYLGRLTGASYGIPPTLAKARADATWIQPKMTGLLPEGMYLTGQDVSVDGFAPAILTGIMCMASIEGVLAWLDVVKMLGGVIETIKVL